MLEIGAKIGRFICSRNDYFKQLSLPKSLHEEMNLRSAVPHFIKHMLCQKPL